MREGHQAYALSFFKDTSGTCVHADGIPMYGQWLFQQDFTDDIEFLVREGRGGPYFRTDAILSVLLGWRKGENSSIVPVPPFFIDVHELMLQSIPYAAANQQQ